MTNTKNIKAFDQTPVWNEARKLALAVYRLTNEPDFDKDWTLRDQVRRAAISIMANIAEGSERGTAKEFIHFLNIATASCAEVKSHLYLALDLAYLDASRFAKAVEAIDINEGRLVLTVTVPSPPLAGGIRGGCRADGHRETPPLHPPASGGSVINKMTGLIT